MTEIAADRGVFGDRDREGTVLAARWSIERLRRPQAPELVWLGYAKPEIASFVCLACGAEGSKQGVLRAEGRTLYLCGECASHQFHPQRAASGALTGFARRCRLEYAIDLTSAAELVARVVARRHGGRLLHLGCGIGFVVDMVTHRPGWSAAGIDPGPLAELGAEALGVDLHCGGAEEVARVARPEDFTVLLCEGALERSADPLALLLAARARATPDARWLLSTADAATLYAAEDAVTLRRMTAPEQVMIPSRIGLRLLLRRAGFEDVEVVSAGGVLRADRQAAELAPAAEPVLDAYLSARLASLPGDESMRAGLLIQALERAVQRHDWPAARRIAARLAAPMAGAVEAARVAADQDSLEALLGRAPVGAASLLYHSGMLHLNDSGPSTQALLCFELSAALAERAHALAPMLMHREADRHWAARFHAGLVLSRMGETAAASRVFEALANGAGPGARAWAERGQAELAAAQVAAVAATRGRRTARSRRTAASPR